MKFQKSEKKKKRENIEALYERLKMIDKNSANSMNIKQGKLHKWEKNSGKLEKNSANGMKISWVKIHKWEKNSEKLEKNSGNHRKKLRKQQNNSENREKNSGDGR